MSDYGRSHQVVYGESVKDSGATYWCLVYPIDTIKSIIQTDPLYAEQMKNSQCLWKDRARYMYSVVKLDVGH